MQLKPLFVYLFFTKAEAGRSRKANTPCSVCIRELQWDRLTDEVHVLRSKPHFSHFRSWEVPIVLGPIWKSSECETRSSWQERAANDILETGLISKQLNHIPLKFAFPNIVYARVQMKSQIVKMYWLRNEMTSNMN